MRENGSILTTRLDAPFLLEIDPSSGQGPYVVHEFKDYLAVGGITETLPNLFTVIAGNFSLFTLTSYPGTYAVFTVDYRPKAISKHGVPKIVKLADVPTAGFLDGATYVPSAEAIFMADAQRGLIFKMDIHTGKYSVAVNNTLTQKCHPKDLEAVNGLKYHNSTLFWTNSGCGYYAKMALDKKGRPVGKASIVSNPKLSMDDFGIALDGTAWLTASFINQIVTISPEGKFKSVAGNWNSTEVAQPTALIFGTTKKDKEHGTIYVTTAGGIGDPINGTVIVGAQLLAIDTK
jgi:sugar lactone lactonase YvrE